MTTTGLTIHGPGRTHPKPRVTGPPWAVVERRAPRWDAAANTLFDVAILGGGINGACLYDRLVSRGHKVCLLDENDFAAGTSQASGMLIWGGLLYLRNLDVATVLRLSAARDAMIDGVSGVQAQPFRYVFSHRGGRGRWLVSSLLHVYWAMGRLRRSRPRHEREFSEAALLRGGAPRGAMLYEEGRLDASDARFVMQWMTPHADSGSVALNHGRLEGGGFDARSDCWHLDVGDAFGTAGATLRARTVVNCTGVWTDSVNARFGIASPFRHALSKGVYVGLERDPEHVTPMIFEMGQHGDLLTWVPWGPVAMFGPTETVVHDVSAGFRVEPDDLRFLLDHADRRLASGANASSVVSLRCGVRPLAVPRAYTAAAYPLDLSRRSHVIEDEHVPWISTYGGKLTGCRLLAEKVASRIERRRPARHPPASVTHAPAEPVQWTRFGELTEPVPSAAWCAEHENCSTLDDYLRRRTNIAQWVPREGLGRDGEHLPALLDITRRCFARDDAHADELLAAYVRSVEQRFDAPLADL